MYLPSALGIDLGTSSIKLVLIDADGAVLERCERTLEVFHPFEGSAEQDPDAWWQALDSAMSELRDHAPKAVKGIAAIGLSGQMHGLVCLDANDSVMRPAILWNDGRAILEAREAAEHPHLEAIAGLRPAPGLTACKLAWIDRHEPETRRRLARVTLCKDYLRLRMTGEHVTDPCDAAGTLLFDEARRDWSDAALAHFGLDRTMVPRVVEGLETTGCLLPELAMRWGLAKCVPVIAGAGDGSAGALGIGATVPESGYISIGTSAQISVTQNHYSSACGSTVQVLAHGLPGLWYRAAALQTGAGALAWAAHAMNCSVSDMVDRAGALDPAGQCPVFLPYLNGERTPHDNPSARGVLFGLRSDHDTGHIGRAVMRGLAFALADGHQALARLGPMPASLYLVGGGTRSALLCRLIASVLDTPLHLLRSDAGGAALGVARLALLSITGRSLADSSNADTPPLRIDPEPELGDRLRNDLEQFRELYRTLVPAFTQAERT